MLWILQSFQTKKEVKQTSIDFAQALDPDLPVSTACLFQAKVVPPRQRRKKRCS